jgi:hypothetical protein
MNWFLLTLAPCLFYSDPLNTTGLRVLSQNRIGFFMSYVCSSGKNSPSRAATPKNFGCRGVDIFSKEIVPHN